MGNAGDCKCQCDTGKTDHHELSAVPEVNDGHEESHNNAFEPLGVVKEEGDESTALFSQASTISVGPLPKITGHNESARRLKGAVHTVMLARRNSNITKDVGIPSNLKPCKASGNGNSPQDYLWLEEVFTQISLNKAADLGCIDTANGTPFIPLFGMFGACPNVMCGMQAVLFLATIDRRVDFWWVKPSKSDSTQIERQTLNRNSSGPHKNDPGRSKPVMQPLANAISKGEVINGWRFGIETVKNLDGREVPRAFIKKDDGKSGPFYVLMLWQEDWTANPLARSKFIKGKILYQRNIRAVQHFSRQFDIKDGVIDISDFEELQSDEILPGDEVKQLYEPKSA